MVKPLVFCDNVSSVLMAHNPVQHARSKHLEIDLFFVREKVINGTVKVTHIASENQLTYLFTESLAQSRFQFMKDKLNVMKPYSPP